MNSLAEQYIVQILAEEMTLAQNEIWVANQNETIPNDGGLYLSVGMVDSQVIGSGSIAYPVSGGGMQEVQQAITRENIQVDIFSQANDALLRRWEIPLALASIYSQQVQELNFFKIFRRPSSFVNTSSAEGGSQLNRFTCVFPCFTWQRKVKDIDYFNDFNGRAQLDPPDAGDNPIEFEIKATDSAPYGVVTSGNT